MKIRQVGITRIVVSGIKLNKKAKELGAPTELAFNLVYEPAMSEANGAARQSFIDGLLALTNPPKVKKASKKRSKPSVAPIGFDDVPEIEMVA